MLKHPKPRPKPRPPKPKSSEEQWLDEWIEKVFNADHDEIVGSSNDCIMDHCFCPPYDEVGV